jgi:hypothetical protein
MMQDSYDPVNDLLVFCRNDNNFYTKHYYPCMAKLSDLRDMKKTLKKSHVLPMLKSGIEQYCDKYDIDKDVFDKGVVSRILETLMKEEMPQIRNGEYRCR